MAPTRAGKYEFRPETLAGLRGQLALKQARMAELLGIPANTLFPLGDRGDDARRRSIGLHIFSGD